MNKMKINKFITIISWTIFILSVLRILFAYHSLPNELGVHYAPNGTFDVITSKDDILLISYPYIMSFVILIVSEILMLVIKKIKVGFKIKKTGEKSLKELIKSLINITKLTYVIYLCVIWSECMIKQLNINPTFMKIFIYVYLFITIVNFIFIIKTIKAYHKKEL